MSSLFTQVSTRIYRQPRAHFRVTVGLGLAFVLIYASTSTALIINLLQIQTSILEFIPMSATQLWLPSHVNEWTFQDAPYPASINFPGPREPGFCASTAALTVNVYLILITLSPARLIIVFRYQDIAGRCNRVLAGFLALAREPCDKSRCDTIVAYDVW